MKGCTIDGEKNLCERCGLEYDPLACQVVRRTNDATDINDSEGGVE